MGRCLQCEHTAKGVVTKQCGKCIKAAVEEELEERKAAIGESIQKLQESKNRIRAAPKRSISDPVPPTKKINTSGDGAVAEPVPPQSVPGGVEGPGVGGGEGGLASSTVEGDENGSSVSEKKDPILNAILKFTETNRQNEYKTK